MNKLVLFIMDRLHWLYLGVLVLVGAIAGQRSIILAVALVLVCVLAIERFLHNSNPLTPWRREQNDAVVFPRV